MHFDRSDLLVPYIEAKQVKVNCWYEKPIEFFRKILRI